MIGRFSGLKRGPVISYAESVMEKVRMAKVRRKLAKAGKVKG